MHAARDRGTTGKLSRVPGANMHRLLETMRPKHQAIFVLSSTCLPRRDIPAAIQDTENVGYKCQETHGVRGVSRAEIAGVMVCIDSAKLKFLPVGNGRRRLKRVVRRGRILRVRLGILGAQDADHASDFNVLGVYMPPRGTGAKGFSDASMNAYVNSVWASLSTDLVLLARRGRTIAAGDFNAELPKSLRGRSRVARPADGNLAHMYEAASIGRVHSLGEWTYTGTYLSKHVYSEIDHIFASADLLGAVQWREVVDGIELGSKRHRALICELRLAVTTSQTDDERAEERAATVDICRQEKRVLSAPPRDQPDDDTELT